MRLNRREFLKASAATSGVLVSGVPLAQPVGGALTVRKAKAAGPGKGEWVSTACQGCTQWCAIQIFVQDGRAVRVRGNPLSKTNHGFICPRGHLIPQVTYDPDRIKSPLKRTNPTIYANSRKREFCSRTARALPRSTDGLRCTSTSS